MSLSLAVILACHLPVSHAADTYQRTWLTYGGFGQRDNASAIAVDSAGNPYMVGETESIYGMPDSGHYGDFVIKYDPSGHQQWLQEFAAGHLYGATFDPSNDLYIAGYADGPARVGDIDAYLIKFDPNASKLLDRRLGSPDNDFGFDVAADSQGNAYFSGSTVGLIGETKTNTYDAFLAKYAPDGTLTWVKQLGALGFYGQSVAVAPDQSIILTGAGNRKSFLVHMDPAGNVVWNKTLDFSANAANGTYAEGIACDPFGNILVVGSTNHPTNSFLQDAFVAKYDSAGNLMWKRIMHTSAENSYGEVAVDSLGNVYAAGATGMYMGANADNYDAMWAKYDSDGNLRWFEQFGTIGEDFLTGIVVDALGHVYLSGSNAYTVNNYYRADVDAFVARYDQVPEPGTLLLVVIGVLFLARWPATRHGRGYREPS